MDEGKIKGIETSKEVAGAYTEVFSSDQEKMLKKSNQKNVIEDKYKDSPLKVKAVRTVVSSKPVNVIASAERFEIEVEVESDLPEDTESLLGNYNHECGIITTDSKKDVVFTGYFKVIKSKTNI